MKALMYACCLAVAIVGCSRRSIPRAEEPQVEGNESTVEDDRQSDEPLPEQSTDEQSEDDTEEPPIVEDDGDSGQQDDDAPMEQEPDRSVFIDRDDAGVPHIYASDLPAAAYGLGYAMAEDQLEGIVKRYITASARLSEYLGRGSADANLNSDQRVLWSRNPEMVSDYYHTLSSDVRDYVESFVAGFNNMLDRRRSEFPWIRDYQVTAQDVYGAMRWDTLSMQIDVGDSERALHGTTVCPEGSGFDDSGNGSNGWVVSAPLTVNDQTIVLSDPHSPWDMDPTDGDRDGLLWYEAHVRIDDHRFGGSFRIGDPVMRPGYTSNIGWAGTSSRADIADVYHLELTNPQQLTYRYGDELRTASRRVHDILVYVDGSSPPEFEVEQYEVIDTSFGPVTTVGADAFAYLLPSMNARGDLEPRYRIIDAAGVDDVIEHVFRPQEIAQGNLLVGGRDGQLLYHLAARVPLRDPAICYGLPLASGDPASLPAFDSGGDLLLAPFEEHPMVRNPTSGYLVNNNSSPVWVTAGDSDVAWHNGLFDPNPNEQEMGYRQRTVRQWFDATAQGQFDVADNTEMAFDQRVPAWDAFKEILTTVVETFPEIWNDPTNSAALAELLNWDGVMSTDARAALVFRGWVGRLNDLEGPGQIPYRAVPDQPSAEQLQAAYDMLVGPNVDQCLRGVIPYLADGTLNGYANAEGALVPWGDVHRLRLPGDRASETRAAPGGDSFLATLFQTNSSQSCPDYGIGDAASGSSVIMQITFNPELSVSMVKPVGNSADANSTNYGTMSDAFTERQFRIIALDQPSTSATELILE